MVSPTLSFLLVNATLAMAEAKLLNDIREVMLPFIDIEIFKVFMEITVYIINSILYLPELAAVYIYTYVGYVFILPPYSYVRDLFV